MPTPTGPVSTLPGSVYSLSKEEEGTIFCDNHPSELAVKYIQGETDSMGAEFIAACNGCIKENEIQRKKSQEGSCDWCGVHSNTLNYFRDIDEGQAGPVYLVCSPCRKKTILRLAKEIEEGYDNDW